MSVAARVACFQLLVLGGKHSGVVVVPPPDFIDACSVFSLRESFTNFQPFAQSTAFVPTILAATDLAQTAFEPSPQSPSFTFSNPPVFKPEGCCP